MGFTQIKSTHLYHGKEQLILNTAEHCVLGLSDTTVLSIYRDILKVSILRYFVINYRDTMPVHYYH